MALHNKVLHEKTSPATKREVQTKSWHLDHQPMLQEPLSLSTVPGACKHQERTKMTSFKVFTVVTALLLCPSLGAGYKCTRRYQRLLREAAVVKAQCPNAAFHDCCQVGVCVRKWILCYSRSQYHLCSTYRRLWGLVVVRLLWLNGRGLAAQGKGVLTPSNCWLFTFLYFCHITPKMYFP